eukprot:scaffold131341_cov31-Tisochrysis_lutea.AAC.13
MSSVSSVHMQGEWTWKRSKPDAYCSGDALISARSTASASSASWEFALVPAARVSAISLRIRSRANCASRSSDAMRCATRGCGAPTLGVESLSMRAASASRARAAPTPSST